MSIKRFALNNEVRKNDLALLSRDEQKHMMVRKVDAGELVELISPTGSWWSGVVVSTKPAKVRIVDFLGKKVKSLLTIFVAVPAANRASVMVDKCTELGLGEFGPMVCEKSTVIPKSSESIKERWTRIAFAASKQSGADLPEILPVMTFEKIVADNPDAIILLPGSSEHLSDIIAKKYGEPCKILIGPELGFTREEAAYARKKGLTCCTLGKNILRVETAAIACCALFSSVENSNIARKT